MLTAPAVPVAPPVFAPVPPPSIAMDLGFAAGSEMVASPRKKKARRRGSNRALWGGLVFLILAGSVAGGLYVARDYLAEVFSGDGDERRAFKTQGNFAFTASRGWRNDETLRGKMRANVALTCKNPRGHAALYYRDFRTRAPSDGELLDTAVKKLRGYFRQVEYEDPFQGENKGRTGELSGERAIVFPFSASDTNEVPMRGECYLLSRQGYAYWMIFWAPEDYVDQVGPYWEALRGGFKLYNERDGWKPRPRETENHVGSALAFQLNFAREVWKKENARDVDETAELYLRGFEPVEDEESGKTRVIEHAGKAAEVLVLVLPKAASLEAAAQAARKHVLEMQMKVHPMIKIEDIPDRKTGKPLSGKEVGGFRGKVDRLRLILDVENERFALVAVVNRNEGVLAVVCECKGDRREYWEQEFRALLETVRAATGKSRTPERPKDGAPARKPPDSSAKDS